MDLMPPIKFIQKDKTIGKARDLLGPEPASQVAGKYMSCRVPARRGLQRTARAVTRHGARDPLVRPQVDNHLGKNFKKKRTAHLIRLFLLRQGEPGTSQYILH